MTREKKVKLTWISHACFRLEAGGKVFYFDPYEIPDGVPKADYVLASHDHYDHLDAKSLAKVVKDDTVVVCPKSCLKSVKKGRAKGVKPGDDVTLGPATVKVVPAYNPNKRFHPKGNGWVGYVVEVEGKRVYHAGDTDQIPEMASLGPVDVAMLPVGDTYTMGFDEAVDAAGVIKPKVVVPMHHWDKDLGEFKRKLEAAHPDVTVEVLEGRDYQF